MSLNDSLTSYWKLDESSGNAADSVGSNSLTNTGTVTFSAGKINNGANFSATKYFTGGNIFNFERTDKFSIAAWFQTTTDATQSIVTKLDSAGTSNGWALRVYDPLANGNLIPIFQLTNNNATNMAQVEGTTNVNSASFQHIVVTYDGSSSASGIKIYINGALDSMTIDQDNLSATTMTTIPFNMGSRNDGALQQFTGMIDEVGIWSRVLSAAEVSQLYNGGNGRSYPFPFSHNYTTLGVGK